MTTRLYKPRARLLVRFADDPRLLHERRVLSSGFAKKDGSLRYTVVTPDRDVQDSRLGMPKISEVIEWPEDHGCNWLQLQSTPSIWSQRAYRGPPT